MTSQIKTASIKPTLNATEPIGKGASGLVALFWVDVGSVLVIGVEESGSGWGPGLSADPVASQWPSQRWLAPLRRAAALYDPQRKWLRVRTE
jgi:hypothetical protein